MGFLQQTPSWQAVLGTALAYFLSVAFYRLFFHPLSTFPGPRLAAVTRYYEAYYDIVQNGQYQFRIAEMHKKYGPIVRISPFELHVNDPSFYNQLFSYKGRWDKYAWSVGAQNASGALVTTVGHDQHKARRQPLNAFFSKAKVNSRLGLFHQHVDRFCGQVSEYAGTRRVLDLGAAISALQRDTANEFVIGKPYNALGEEDFGRDVTGIIRGAGRLWRISKHFRWYGPALSAIPRDFIFKYAQKPTVNFLKYIRDSELETERLLKAAASKDLDDKKRPRTIVDEITNSNLPSEEKAFKRISADVLSITAAGMETTANVLRVIVYYTFSNAEILARLRAELSEAPIQSSSKENQLEVAKLEKLPYLTAILMEGMRMSPGLVTRSQRVAPDRELVYGKWHIPAGTPVGMTDMFMYMNEYLYPDAKKFNPDRWVDTEARKTAEKTFSPFSRGPRMCLGIHVAWTEMYLMVATLALRFDLDFMGLEADHFEVLSDQFVGETKGKAVLEVLVAHRCV